MAPGDVTNGLGHGGHGDAETQGDPDILGLGGQRYYTRWAEATLASDPLIEAILWL